ncbi:RHS repeat-associated core domain-containing protein [Paenibacillus sp. DYY-L-2]|uniref:RHS repeat-associated core domain-containing protein n=1 Tax=Paenibacillus sp. DYY-L-2 TaxID=3447013 RepID=UPI003F4F7A4B
MKIELNPGDLKQTGKTLKSAAREMEDLQSDLQRAMNRLTLESRSRSDVDGNFRRISQSLGELNKELLELSDLSTRKGEEFADDDAYGQKIEKGKWWEVFKTGVSMALDFVPIIGNAKGIIEAVTGRDLITGEKLAAWERALAIAGPLGKTVRNGAKVLKFADEVADGVQFVAKHGDEVAGLAGKTDDVAAAVNHGADIAGAAAGTTKAGDAVSDAGKLSGQLGSKTANAADVLKDGEKLSDSVATVAQAGNRAANAAEVADGLSDAEKLAAVAAAGGAGTVVGGIAAGMAKAGKAADTAGDAVSDVTRAADKASDARKAGDSASHTPDVSQKQSKNPESGNPKSMAGDPIHMGTGDQLISHTVLKLYGAAVWPFTLHYHSGLLQVSEMGAAWTHNYAMRLDLEEASSSENPVITVCWNASRKNKYERRTDGVYQTEDIGVKFDELHPVEDGYELIYRSKQETFLFSKDGRLLEHRNAEGQVLLVEQNEPGLTERLTDNITGRSLRFVYNETGLLTAVEDGKRTVRFAYNENRHMSRLVDANGQATDIVCDEEGRILSVSTNGKLEFENTFDERHRIVAQLDPNGQMTYLDYDTDSLPGHTITTLTNPLGLQTRYVHNAHDLLTEMEHPDGRKINYTYNEQGQEVRRAYSDGRVISRSYDERGRLAEVTDELGRSTRYAYNERDQRVREIDAEGRETRYEYDELHRLVKVIRADGSLSETGYTAAGQISFYRDFSGAVRTFTYGTSRELAGWEDAEGRRTEVAVDEAGRIATVEDALGNVFMREYDGNDNLIRAQDALGHTWEYFYDADNHLIVSKDPLGAETRYTYTVSGKLASVTDPLGHTAEYRYDEADRLITQINPAGERTTLEYDAGDRLVAVVDPLGRKTQYQYDAAGRMQAVIDGEGRLVRQLTYDQAGNPIAVTNGLGHTARYRFNEVNRLTEETDASGRVTRYKYDALSRLTEVTEADQAVYRQECDREGRITAYEDAGGSRTELRYDQTGLLIEERNASGHGITYAYDLRGLLSNRVNARQQSTAYRYDAAGRLVGLEDEAGEIRIAYDAGGRVVSLTEGEAVLSRVYDAAGRLVSSTDTLGYTIGYKYDEAGRLTRLTYPDGKQVHYRYNAAGEMVEVKDWKGRLTRYGYDQSGKLAETIRSNGSREKRTYDAAGQLIRIQDSTPQGVMLQQYRLTYNGIGQIVQEEDKQYTYDNLRRLSSGAAKGRIVSYEYDRTGNITLTRDSLNGKGSSFSYTADNRLQALGDYPVEMDADGNLLYRSNGESMASYEYDARNRLVKSGKAKYTYNMLGTRTTLTWRGKTTQYVTDDLGELSRVLMELDEDGAPKAYYVYGLGLIGREDAEGNYVSYHSDVRGSTTLLTDENGRVTDRYTYGNYGELEEHIGITNQPFRYNGRDGVMTDPNGLYYMRARYYDPELKRFLNRDVIQGDLTDGQTLNRYAYVNGDPVGYVDPLGLSKWDVEPKKTPYRYELDLQMFASKGTGDAPVPTKPGGGSNPSDFVNPHSEKHMYDPSRPSTPNRSQYGEDVDVGRLRQETMTNPDKAYSNWPNPNNPNTQRITKYYKEFDGNISTPDTPTGSHRVFENLDDPTRSSHFPYVPRK